MVRKKLQDISVKISSGLTPLRSNLEFWEHGTIPWLKTEQLGEKYIYDTTEYITAKALADTSLKLFPAETISIAMYGEGKTRGNLSILKKPMATNQACCNIEIDTRIADVEYVYYFLKTQYEALRSLSSGVRKNLNSNDIKNYSISLPYDIIIQKKISSVLSALDKKIDCNNRINAELEAMAKTLYDYWFVQFDFPNKDGKPYKASGGAMHYNEELKRDIPEGWEVKALGEVEANIITGKTPSTTRDDFYGKNIPFITIGDIRGNTYIATTEQCLSFLGAESQEKKYLPENSICVSCIATVGLIGFTTEKSQTNQQINSIVCHTQNNLFYLYFALKNYFQYAQGAKTGATFANMNKQEFSAINVLVPSEDIKNTFYEVINPIFCKIKSLTLENQELAKLRDWLLPMLMNGQVNVEDV